MHIGLGVTLLSIHIAVTTLQTWVVAEILDCGLQGKYQVNAYLYWDTRRGWTWDVANTTCTEHNRLLTTERSMIEDCVLNTWAAGTWRVWSRKQNGRCYYIRYKDREFEAFDTERCSYAYYLFICEDKRTSTTQIHASTRRRTETVSTVTSSIGLSSQNIDKVTATTQVHATTTQQTETVSTTSSSIGLSSQEVESSTTQWLTSPVISSKESDSGTAEAATVNGGIIAGIVIGVLLLFVIACVLVVLFRRGKLKIQRRKNEAGVSNNEYQSGFSDHQQNLTCAKGTEGVRTESTVKYQTSNGAVVCNINADRDTDGTYETAEYFTLENNNNKGQVEPVYEFASDPSGSIQTYNNAVVNDLGSPENTNTYDHINKPTLDKAQDHVYSHTEAAPESEYAHTSTSTKSASNVRSNDDDTYNHVRGQRCGSGDYKGHDGEYISNNNQTTTVMTSVPTDDTYSHVGN